MMGPQAIFGIRGNPDIEGVRRRGVSLVFGLFIWLSLIHTYGQCKVPSLLYIHMDNVKNQCLLK